MLFAGISVLSLLSLVSLQILLRWFNERHLLVVYNFCLTLGLAIYVDWNNGEQPVVTRLRQGYISLARFLVGIFFISLGYACAAALLLAVFTKILNENEQVCRFLLCD